MGESTCLIGNQVNVVNIPSPKYKPGIPPLISELTLFVTFGVL